MEASVWVALITMPAGLIMAIATFRKASSADRAVNHRVGGTTVSEDISDMRHEIREMHKDLIWISRAFNRHLKEEHGYGREEE